MAPVAKKCDQSARLVAMFNDAMRVQAAYRYAGRWLTRCVGTQRAWRRAGALGLAMTYAALLLFASLCLATGSWHPDIPDAHHHGPQHAGVDAAHPSVLPDICDVVLLTIMTTELRTVHLSPDVVLPSTAVALAPVLLISSNPVAAHGIRAPPASYA